MDCCLRVAGLARIIRDRETKARIAGHCDFFSKHWKDTDDPDYTLLEIRPTEIEYVTPKKTTRMKT
jgi:general stress protein 26